MKSSRSSTNSPAVRDDYPRPDLGRLAEAAKRRCCSSQGAPCRVHGHSGGAEDNCEIVCSGVRDLHIFNESSSLWDFVEVTAASARPIPDGSMVLDLTMWTDNASLTI